MGLAGKKFTEDEMVNIPSIIDLEIRKQQLLERPTTDRERRLEQIVLMTGWQEFVASCEGVMLSELLADGRDH